MGPALLPSAQHPIFAVAGASNSHPLICPFRTFDTPYRKTSSGIWSSECSCNLHYQERVVIPVRVTIFTPADGRGILASASSTRKQKGICAIKSGTYL